MICGAQGQELILEEILLTCLSLLLYYTIL